MTSPEPAVRLRPMGPDEYPACVAASKASDFYTGHILYADGGYTAG